MGDCGKETRFCCSVTHARYAQTCIADTISIKISCAWSFKKHTKKNPSNPMQCCPAKALTWMTQIRTRIRVCQRIMKTPARLLTGLGQSCKANVCGNFFLKKSGWGKRHFYRPFSKLNHLKNSCHGR